VTLSKSLEIFRPDLLDASLVNFTFCDQAGIDQLP